MEGIMTPLSPPLAALLADLAMCGIEVEPHGNTIRYRPQSAMTPTILERLRTHKTELRTVLEQSRSMPELAVKTAENDSAKGAKRPIAMLPEEEAKICRWIEMDKNLPA